MKSATYEDILNAPRNKVAEILDGELFLSPRPSPRHAVAASRLGMVLGPFDDDPGGPGGWWILDEPELHFGEQVVVPDLAGWRRERLPATVVERDQPLLIRSVRRHRIDLRRPGPVGDERDPPTVGASCCFGRQLVLERRIADHQVVAACGTPASQGERIHRVTDDQA